MRNLLAIVLVLSAFGCSDDASPGGMDLGPDASATLDLRAVDLSTSGATCASVGGTCVAVVPNVCQTGTLHAEYSCGPGVGSTCCIQNVDAGTD